MPEGVTKFVAHHAPAALDPRVVGHALAPLAAWRAVLFATGGIGQDPRRYDGAGYGNVSVRLPPWSGARGRRPFLISGTQTGHLACAGAEDFCVVTAWRLGENEVTSTGPVAPSSESLTHGAVYDLSPHLRAVVHVHAPVIFQAWEALGLPATPPDVEYGTPAMARATDRLWRETALSVHGCFVMAGHEDGVVAVGASLDEAATRLLRLLARALSLGFAREGSVCDPRLG